MSISCRVNGLLKTFGYDGSSPSLKLKDTEFRSQSIVRQPAGRPVIQVTPIGEDIAGHTFESTSSRWALTNTTGVAFRQLFKATGTTLGSSATANGITRIAMVGLNVYRHGGEVAGLVSQSLQEQIDAALKLVGRYRGLSLVQRVAYDHSSSTKYSSLYTLVDYTADSEMVLI